MPSSTSSTPTHSPDRERKRHSTRKPREEERASNKSTTKENNSNHNHHLHPHHHDQHHHHHHKHHHEHSDKKHEIEHKDKDRDRQESHGYGHAPKQGDPGHHHQPHSKEGNEDDDGSESLESTRSQADLSQAQETPALTTLDMLKRLSGSKVRRAKLCQPDFLEELGRKSGKLVELDAKLAKKLKVVAGSESVAFLKLFKSHDHPGDVPPWLKTESRKGHSSHELLKPVVFAVKSVEGGRKVIDYYMTWRGNTKARLLRDAERRDIVLDSEFRTVVKALDYEYSRLSLNDIADAQLSRTTNKSRQSEKGMLRSQSDPLPSSEKRRPPPSINISVSEPILPTVPESPPSANGSVISLPLLSMIRNVPMGNRLPLRVTNPDRSSMISCDNVEPPVPIQLPRNNDSLDTLVEESESIESARNANPESQHQVRHDTLMQCDPDQPNEGRRKSHHHEVPGLHKREEARGHQHQHEPSSSRKKDEGGDSATHKQKHHRSSKYIDRGKREHEHEKDTQGGKKRKDDDDDRSSFRSDKRDSSSIPRKPNLDKLSSEFVIVLVDVNDLEKEPRSAWHKLWNVVSTRSVTKKNTSPAKVTPWSGPLVGSIEEPVPGHAHTPYGTASDSEYENPLVQDDESDEGGPYNGEVEWMSPPVIPGNVVSTNMQASAYPGSTHILPPTFSIARSTYSSSPVIPGDNMSRIPSNDPSPVMPNITPPMPDNVINASPNASLMSGPNIYASPISSMYGTPRPAGSPYVNAYISPRSTNELSLPGIGSSLQHAMSLSMRSPGSTSTYLSPMGVSTPIPLPIYPNVYVPSMSHVSVRESPGY